MTDADKPEFLRILTGLAAVKPGAKLTPEALSVWWMSLRDWSMDEFRAAASHLALTAEFMPNPFHFHQLRQKSADTASGEAWARVLDAIRTMHPQAAPTIDAKTDAVVRAMGGYRALAMASSADMHFREKRFAELWADMGEVIEARALPFDGPKKIANGPRRLFSA